METVWLIGPLLLLGVVLTAVWLDRFSVPVILVALGLGLVAGGDVLGLWHFDDASLANEVANVSLVFILFQGGLMTKRSALREVALPAGSLATAGVLVTAALTFWVLHYGLGWSFERSLLLGAVISSTDAAAIFSILRRHALPSRVSSTIEVESAANDPMAILITIVVVEAVASNAALDWVIVPVFLWKFLAGPLVGWVMARIALGAFDRLNPQDRGFYYVLLIALVPLTYGLADLIQASGMLAVFAAGLVMGNERFTYQQGVRNFSAALSMIANIGVFLLMGLLVSPKHFATMWLDGVLLFLVLTFVARPVAVWLGTIRSGFNTKEKTFIAWAGLRGSVPIVLATYPMAAKLADGQAIFDLVFFAVILSVGLQGSSLGVVADWLGLSTPARPAPRYGLELVTMAHSELDLIVVDLPGPAGRPGPRIRELTLPPAAILTLVTRGNGVIAPGGNTRLLGWDQVTVLARAVDEDEVREALLAPFNREVEDDHAARVLDAQPEVTPGPEAEALRGHVVLLGYGAVGHVLAGFMRQRGQAFIVIEPDATSVEELRREGLRVLHGRGEDMELLRQARVEDAKLLLVTMTQPVSARRAVEHAVALNANLKVVARVDHASVREVLQALPRTECVQGEVELAYAMARRMLLACGVTAIEVEALLMDARRQSEGQAGSPTRIVELYVEADSSAVGKRLSQLELPPGALVITISRHGEFVVPSGQTEIHAHDALLVLADVDKAHVIEAALRAPQPAAPVGEESSRPDAGAE